MGAVSAASGRGGRPSPSRRRRLAPGSSRCGDRPAKGIPGSQDARNMRRLRIADCGLLRDGVVGDGRRDCVAFAIEKGGIGRAGAKGRMLEQADQERQIRADAANRKLAQRRRQARDCQVARFRRRDHLRNHRVVVDRHLVAFRDAGIDADARPPGLTIAEQAAGLRQEPLRGILGINARFDRVPALADVALAPRAAARPSATSSCARTRSTPVTCSVTVCSTCSRVFISRK